MRCHPGVAAKVFEVLGERGDQHRDDLHLADQDLLRRSPPTASPTRCRALHEAFELGARRGPARGPDGRQHRPRSAAEPVILSDGGDGYRVGSRRHRRVGSTILERARRARLPRARGRAVRLRALGRQADRVERPAARVPAAERGDDPGPRRRALLGRRRGQRRVGAALRRGRRGRRRQHQLLAHARRRAARRRRGQPRRRSTGHQGHRRQPELLDDADGRGAEADPRRGRDRAAGRLHLPGGLRHRQGGDRGAARAVAGGARRRSDAGRRRSIRTRSPSTSCPRSRPSRTATTTRPRSAR